MACVGAVLEHAEREMYAVFGGRAREEVYVPDIVTALQCPFGYTVMENLEIRLAGA